MQLPKTWHDEKSNILTQFLQRFDRELNMRRIKCIYGCEATCESKEHSSLLHWRPEDEYYGIIRMTCYQCKKIFCGSCEENSRIGYCSCCEKFYCEDCSVVDYCVGGDCLGPGLISSCQICMVMKNWCVQLFGNLRLQYVKLLVLNSTFHNLLHFVYSDNCFDVYCKNCMVVNKW